MRTLLIPAVTAAIAIAAMLYQAQTADPVLTEAPAARLGELPGFVSEAIEPSEAERHTLPDDTLFDKRLYTATDGTWFQVTLVTGGRSKSSIHRPELCLPPQGFQMMNPPTIVVAGVDWHLVTLAFNDASTLGFAYTFFNQEGFRTSSHLLRIFVDVWDRSILGRIDRWVMVTVNASTSDERRLSEFLRLVRGVVP